MRALVAAIAACSASALAQTAPAGPDYATAVPVPGSWRYAPLAGGSSAQFGSAPGASLLTFTCDRYARRVSISRPATGAAPYLFVWSSTISRNLPASFNPATRLLTADLSAYDRLLDALAFSRGRIAVRSASGGMLVAPLWPEIIRVVEDCRS